MGVIWKWFRSGLWYDVGWLLTSDSECISLNCPFDRPCGLCVLAVCLSACVSGCSVWSEDANVPSCEYVYSIGPVPAEVVSVWSERCRSAD